MAEGEVKGGHLEGAIVHDANQLGYKGIII